MKSLAEQTAKATNEIAQQITEIQEATHASVASITTIGEVIRNVESVSAAISAAVEQQNAVTADISRTVEETSHAAREVASQIASVSAEAVETGRRASEIHDGSTAIAENVAELRTTLIRVIRTSTTDVDRRLASRVAFRRSGALLWRSETKRIEVRDVSLGAVLIECSLPDAAIGESVELTIEGLSFRLGGVVGRMDRGSVLINLNLTTESEQKLSEILSTERARAAAA